MSHAEAIERSAADVRETSDRASQIQEEVETLSHRLADQRRLTAAILREIDLEIGSGQIDALLDDEESCRETARLKIELLRRNANSVVAVLVELGVKPDEAVAIAADSSACSQTVKDVLSSFEIDRASALAAASEQHQADLRTRESELRAEVDRQVEDVRSSAAQVEAGLRGELQQQLAAVLEVKRWNSDLESHLENERSVVSDLQEMIAKQSGDSEGLEVQNAERIRSLREEHRLSCEKIREENRAAVAALEGEHETALAALRDRIQTLEGEKLEVIEQMEGVKSASATLNDSWQHKVAMLNETLARVEDALAAEKDEIERLKSEHDVAQDERQAQLFEEHRLQLQRKDVEKVQLCDQLREEHAAEVQMLKRRSADELESATAELRGIWGGERRAVYPGD